MPEPVSEKDHAEAAKFAAEAEAANALAALHKVSAQKVAAEAQKIALEAEQVAIEAEAGRIDLETARRKERAELARDCHHHRYAFTESVTPSSVGKCLVQLTEWAWIDEACPIEIVFTSPGGSIVDGMALFDFIQQLRRQGHEVTTSTLGLAASMAGILLQAGDKRVMGKEAWLLIHEASFAAGGKIGEVEDTVEWVKKVCDRVLDIFIARSNVSRSFIKKNWTRRDWWISSDEALRFGFVDEIA